MNQKTQKIPATDAFESKEEYILFVDLPGVDDKALAVTVKDAELTLRAQVGEAAYERSFNVPSTVDPDRIAVELRAGLAKIRMPKGKAAEKRAIPISVS